jgi:hypothetical protein
LPDEDWWFPYWRVAHLSGHRLTEVMTWPTWEVATYLRGYGALTEAQNAIQAAHARAQARGLPKAPGIG